MRIQVHENTASPCKRYTASLISSTGTIATVHDPIQVENSFDVYVNGHLTMALTCSADHVAELVVGRLYTEGLVASAAEIDDVFVDMPAGSARISLVDRSADLSARHMDVVSTCYAYNAKATAPTHGPTDLHPVTPILWTPEQIFSLARVFEQDTPIHKQTFGAHSCYLCKGDVILYCCEDLGRHNAFDKVVGCALRDDVDLRECLVFTSGRIPTDMALKAVRARIPLIVSKAVPTNLTVELARASNLTLICSAHSDSMKVFNDPLGK